MPTYEYRRKDGSVFEYSQGINDKPLDHCPSTGQPVTRLISGGGGVMYKGDGWYVTDYKNKDGNTASSGDSQKNSSAEESRESSAAKDGKTENSSAKNSSTIKENPDP